MRTTSLRYAAQQEQEHRTLLALESMAENLAKIEKHLDKLVNPQFTYEHIEQQSRYMR